MARLEASPGRSVRREECRERKSEENGEKIEGNRAQQNRRAPEKGNAFAERAESRRSAVNHVLRFRVNQGQQEHEEKTGDGVDEIDLGRGMGDGDDRAGQRRSDDGRHFPGAAGPRRRVLEGVLGEDLRG
jgi:hypothetical protein